MSDVALDPDESMTPGNPSGWVACVNWAAMTDQGPVRGNNEDALTVLPGVAIVADGMGGHQAGEVASQIALDVLAAHLGTGDLPDDARIRDAFDLAQQRIVAVAEEDAACAGMGSTAVAVAWRGLHAVVAHCGDSRAYLFRAGQVVRLTQDHSLVEAVRASPELAGQWDESQLAQWRGLILRALGPTDQWQPDILALRFEVGDKVLLCSDGLTDVLTDEALRKLVLQDDLGLEPRVQALISAAIREGTTDNVSVVLLDVTGVPDQSPQPCQDGNAAADHADAITVVRGSHGHKSR